MTTVTANDKQITIVLDIETPAPSQSGKTLIVASTRGPLRTTVSVNGKPLTVNVNCYIAK